MRLRTRQIVTVGLLGGLTVALGLAPVGGFIPVPTPAGSATTMHLPTILAGVLEGPLAGAMVGFIFGAFSFWRAQLSPNPVVKLMFSDPLVAFLPRILIGVVAAYTFRLSKGRWTQPLLVLAVAVVIGHSALVGLEGVQAVAVHPGLPEAAAVVAAVLAGAGAFLVVRRAGGAPMVAALAGTLTNTVGVLGLIVWRGYLPGKAAVAVGVLHGLPEILVAMVLVGAVYRAVEHFMGQGRGPEVKAS